MGKGILAGTEVRANQKTPGDRQREGEDRDRAPRAGKTGDHWALHTRDDATAIKWEDQPAGRFSVSAKGDSAETEGAERRLSTSTLQTQRGSYFYPHYTDKRN